ncbi:MAG: hypothetical protein LBP81_02920 [Treponema sp.]|jgi:hypothetical protein|nr:hypothetical protein [Treponema sp.]
MIFRNNPARIIPYGRGMVLLLALVSPVVLSASPVASPTWGFCIDPPEGYQLTGGDGKDRFSFGFLEEETQLDLVVYAGALQPDGSRSKNPYASVAVLAADVQRRLNSQGDLKPFTYRNKQAILMELRFLGINGLSQGWALCIELASPEPAGEKPLLLALAYGPVQRGNIPDVHFSALDSIAPTPQDRLVPGPITEYHYPRGMQRQVSLAGLPVEALIYEHDAAAAQALVDREFRILRRYSASPQWKEAWIRFYRAIYRDSFDRLAHAAFILERFWNIPALEDRDLAEKALHWVQSFTYERDLGGSDFVNLVSAAVEGRGDCDSRALLWALILEQANIPAAIMVSPHYSHAMGLADLPGTGARFTLEGTSWLVAETTSPVSLGRISAQMRETRYWVGVALE